MILGPHCIDLPQVPGGLLVAHLLSTCLPEEEPRTGREHQRGPRQAALVVPGKVELPQARRTVSEMEAQLQAASAPVAVHRPEALRTAVLPEEAHRTLVAGRKVRGVAAGQRAEEALLQWHTGCWGLPWAPMPENLAAAVAAFLRRTFRMGREAGVLRSCLRLRTCFLRTAAVAASWAGGAHSSRFEARQGQVRQPEAAHTGPARRSPSVSAHHSEGPTKSFAQTDQRGSTCCTNFGRSVAYSY